MPRTKQKDSATELAERMVHCLQAQREQSVQAYPLTLARLGQLADEQATPELIARAAKKKGFKEQTLLAKLDKTSSLVALAGDETALADSERLLESALRAATPKKPAAQPVTRIAAKVAASLRPAFAEALQRRLRQRAFPPNIGVLGEDGAARLYLRDRPPEEVRAADLATHLVQTLQALRDLGPQHYPLSLSRLLVLSASQASPQLLKKALANETFQKEIVRAVPRDPETPVALAVDCDRLAGSGQLLEYLLVRATRPAVKAFPLKDLQKPLVEKLRQSFVDTINLHVERGQLPPTVGSLWIKSRYLFLRKDVQGHAAAELRTERSGVNGPDDLFDFASAFAAAFAQLDRQAGGRNFVSLVELRRALPVPRARFDAELFRLREAGTFSLGAAEGRHGISAEEQDAGIREEGSLLLFVSRVNA